MWQNFLFFLYQLKFKPTLEPNHLDKMSENLVPAAKVANGITTSFSEDPNFAVKDGLARMFKVLFFFPFFFLIFN
jgi:hypothetical protein